MRIIQLTQGRETIVDEDDFERVSQYKWYFGGRGYAIRRDGEGKMSLHRLVMNAPKGLEVDHINGNRLDNRKENLRLCTVLENHRNKKIQKNNKSGFKGVSWAKVNKKYRALIMISGKLIHLGCYQDPKEAAKAYDEAAIKYFGKFAKLNFG